MLGENLEIAPPPFRNMLEDAKKHAERNIVSKQTFFQKALECKVKFNKPSGTFPPMSTVSRIQTESPGLPNGSLNLPGNTNNVEKVLIKHYFKHFMRFNRRSSPLNKVNVVIWYLYIPTSFECIPFYRTRWSDIDDALDQNVGTFWRNKGLKYFFKS